MKTSKRDILISKINALDGLTADEKAQIAEYISTKTFGLVWENKPEKAEDVLKTSLPVLGEVPERRIINDPAAPNHIIIEGDNLHALTALTYTHKEKIDVIYIDPPYNTGNKDFVYNDSFVDKDDDYKHCKWLSFMEKRLTIAKELLSPKGVIFVSIDDNEMAECKLLLEKIYGGGNFVANIVWQRTYSPRNDAKGVSQEAEYIITFSKFQNWQPNKLPRTAEMDAKYKNPDNDISLWRTSDAFAPSAATHQGMVYAIQHPFTGKMIYPYKGACWPLQQDKMFEEISKWGNYEYKDLKDDKERAEVCGVSEEDIRKGVLGIVLIDPIEIASKKAQEIYDKGKWPKFFFTNKGKGGIARKTYIDNVGGKNVTNFWSYDDVGHTDFAQKEIKAIFGDKKFDTPKPSTLVKRIMQIASNKDSVVLDFFAGSGTTLHAAMLLNEEDGGHRQCILVTNNENQICENVTYERNRRVINGYPDPKGQMVMGLHCNNLRYYRTEFVSNERTRKNKLRLVRLAVDLLCVKEDIYNEKDSFFSIENINKEDFRYFEENGKKMLVIFNEDIIADIVDVISGAQYEGQIKIYGFSPDNDLYSDEFSEVSDRVKLCALPSAIYNAYRNIIKRAQESEPYADDVETVCTPSQQIQQPTLDL